MLQMWRISTSSATPVRIFSHDFRFFLCLVLFCLLNLVFLGFLEFLLVSCVVLFRFFSHDFHFLLDFRFSVSFWVSWSCFLCFMCSL